MKRNNTAIDFKPVNNTELCKKTAVHEAGHAAAIYLGNKQKQLPPVFFRIIMNQVEDQPFAACQAIVEGGRLIHTLPGSIIEATRDFTYEQKMGYQQAFEADIINFLVGPLAEANYIAQRDNEIINHRLLNLNALHNYGGSSDLKIANDYLECFINSHSDRINKIGELFIAAHSFIKNRYVWHGITALADYILEDNKTVIDYEEIVEVLDAHYYTGRKNSWF